jgi:hypothetical protein
VTLDAVDPHRSTSPFARSTADSSRYRLSGTKACTKQNAGKRKRPSLVGSSVRRFVVPRTALFFSANALTEMTQQPGNTRLLLAAGFGAGFGSAMLFNKLAGMYSTFVFERLTNNILLTFSEAIGLVTGAPPGVRETHSGEGFVETLGRVLVPPRHEHPPSTPPSADDVADDDVASEAEDNELPAEFARNGLDVLFERSGGGEA